MAKQYVIVGIKPGVIVDPTYGKLNLKMASQALLKKLFDAGSPYVEKDGEKATKAPVVNHISQVVLPGEGGKKAQKPEAPAELTPEQVVELALRKTLLQEVGNFYLFEGQRYGKKAIFSKPEVIEVIRISLTSQ